MTRERDLFLRHRTYFVRYRIPAKLQPRLGGKTEIVRTTGEHDLRLARLARDTRVLPAIHAEIARLLDLQPPPTPSDPQSIVAAAAWYREALRARTISPEDANYHFGEAVDRHVETRKDRDPITGEPEDADGTLDKVLVKAGRLVGDPDFRTLEEFKTTYLKSLRLVQATIDARRTEIVRFIKWASPDCDARTFRRTDAIRYVDEIIIPWGRKDNTKKAALSHLSAFFSWVQDTIGLDLNPFHRVSTRLPKSFRGIEETKRAWHESELVTLLEANFPRPDLSAAVLIALYTGARIEEICTIRVAAVNTGEMVGPNNPYPQSMRTQSGEVKNAPSIRSIPIHPIIAPLICKLVETSWDDYLISGLIGVGDKRSQFISNDFGTWCDKIGLHNPQLDLHGMRRTLLTACESAGVAESTANLITGHKRKGIGYGGYSKGDHALASNAIRLVGFGKTDAIASQLVAAHPGNPKKGTFPRRTLSKRIAVERAAAQIARA